MKIESTYNVSNLTAQGWLMAQDRYDSMSLWDRIFRRPLADNVVVKLEPEKSLISYSQDI